MWAKKMSAKKMQAKKLRAKSKQENSGTAQPLAQSSSV